MATDLSVCFAGDKLYGDDFSIEEIKKWFDDEKEGYAKLVAEDHSAYRYSYHALNLHHGFRHIQRTKKGNVLGLGSAFGDEFKPILDQIDSLTILDPSETFSRSKDINGVPCRYVKPALNGDLPFDNNAFQLITSLGTLHHIPNVSHVLNECHRCLAPQGRMLVREPIISLGDWTKPRVGLTKRERGIPLELFREMISTAGFHVEHEALCGFPIIPKITNKLGIAAYNSRSLVLLDSLVCTIFRWNKRYHRTSLMQKFGPTSVYFVLRKE